MKISREYTKEEIQQMFLSRIRALARYWGNETHITRERAADGLVHSILTLIDGMAGDFPLLDLVLRPHPDDQRFHVTNGENYFPYGVAFNTDVYLNDMYFRNRDPITEKQPEDKAEEKQQGLYPKYIVHRADDGSVVKDAFVLIPPKGDADAQAIMTYATFTENRTLAEDLINWYYTIQKENASRELENERLDTIRSLSFLQEDKNDQDTHLDG